MTTQDQTNSITDDNSSNDESLDSIKANRDRILGEKKLWQSKAKEFESKLANYDLKFKEIETKEMEAKGDLKKLLDLERESKANIEKDLLKAREELNSEAEEKKSRKKFASVLQSFDGGLDKRWWGLIDLEQVVIDPDTNEVDKASVGKLVSTLKDTYPEMLRGNVPGMPKNAPQNAGHTIGYEDWKALSFKDKQKWRNEQIVLLK